MFSFVDKAPDGKPLKAALIGCGSRGTGAAFNFLNAGNDLSIVALADVLPDRLESCRSSQQTCVHGKWKNRQPLIRLASAQLW